MSIFIIGCLGIACVYFLKRAHDARTENAMLRGQVASLKRQLAKKRS